MDHHEIACMVDRIESHQPPRNRRLNDFVKTRDGRKARIISVDKAGSKNVVALVMNENGTEGVHDYYPDGNFYVQSVGGPEHPLDLVNVL